VGIGTVCTQPAKASAAKTIEKRLIPMVTLPCPACQSFSDPTAQLPDPHRNLTGLALRCEGPYHRAMFTIEHEFDATVITLVDEGDPDMPLQEDVIIEAFEDCVVIRQVDDMTDEPQIVTLSMAQLRDLAAALDLPEGSYRIDKKP
jgi:hypothetical protein